MSKPGVFKKIRDTDRTVTPFKVFKSWKFETSQSLDKIGIQRIAAVKPNRQVFSGRLATYESFEVVNDIGSSLINVTNDKEASVIWYSLNHLYYKRAGQPYETFGNTNHSNIERTIFDEASVISIPQSIFGEQIQPGSIKINLRNSGLNNNVSMSFIDDGNGNLIDLDLSSSIPGEILYLGFNTSTYDNNWIDRPDGAPADALMPVYKFAVDTKIQELNVTGKNIWLVPRYNLPSASAALNWGNAAYYNGDGFIRIPKNKSLDFKQSEDWSITFWTHRVGPTNGNDQYILSKRTTATGEVIKNKIQRTQDVNYNISQYPFEILYKNSTNSLVCRQSDGSKTVELSTNEVAVGDRKHICFQKTGSYLQLYVNGTKVVDKRGTNENVQNEADIFIGSLGLDLKTGNGYKGISGSIDEFYIFERGLTDVEVLQLAYTGSLNLMTINTNVVGNIFYEHGMVVISDPRPKYGSAANRMFSDQLIDRNQHIRLTGSMTEFFMQFNSEVTLYEHEYICRLDEDEFNFTANPTIRIDNDYTSDLPKAIVANPQFAPYITTVGLYNKNYELVATGKLGTPIRKRDNVDLNILVRFDM